MKTHKWLPPIAQSVADLTSVAVNYYGNATECNKAKAARKARRIQRRK